MKKISILKVPFIILALLLAISLAACGGTAQDNSKGGAEGTPAGSLTGKITISGSTAVQMLVQDLADAFKTAEPGITIEVLDGTSAQGIIDVAAGTSDLGASSRELKDEEKKPDLTEHLIAYDGIAVVTNPANTAASLTKEQLAGIFKGEIKNWNKVGGPDKEILAVVREENSGIRDDFQEVLGLKDIRQDALQADGAGAMNANIAAKDNALGYTSSGYADNSLKKLAIEGVDCTPASIKDKSYPFTEPLLLISKGEVKPEVKAFLAFIEGENGQKLIGEKYIPAK